jgi:hypothetical protein
MYYSISVIKIHTVAKLPFMVVLVGINIYYGSKSVTRIIIITLYRLETIDNQ